MASQASKAATALAAKTTAAFQKSAKAVSSFQFAPKSLGGLEMQSSQRNSKCRTIKRRDKEITSIRRSQTKKS